jgi:metallo-beta-lactamase class B
MRRQIFAAIFAVCLAAAFLCAQGGGASGGGLRGTGAAAQAPAGAAQGRGRQGGRGAGGGGGAGGGAGSRDGGSTASGFGTTNTLTTIAEAGQGGGAGDPTVEQLAASPEAQAIIANARKIAGTDLADFANQYCTWNAGANVPPHSNFGTVQVFDNLYYSGVGSVGAWIIKTSAGIILWDTLDNEEEAKTVLEPGMRKFGMDPSQIRYIVIGHSHFDHIGGGEYLQRMYNPTILMGRLDWDTVMVNPPPHMRRGMDVIDGQKLTLGDTTITLFLLPGHTPGSVSSIIPVQYQGRKFNILNLTASRFSTYSSLAPFERIFDEAKRAKVEGIYQVHPEINMNRTALMESLHIYPPVGPHPLLFPPDKAARLMDVELECGRARIAANRTALNGAHTPEYFWTPEAPATAVPASVAPGAGAGGRGR